MSQAQNGPILPAWRFRLLLGMIALVVVLLGWRALNLQVLDNGFLQYKGDSQHKRVVSLMAHRGMLLDRNGDALAVSTPVASVWADPKDVPLDDPRIEQLARLLDKPADKLRELLSKRARRDFVYLKRHMNPDIKQRLAELGLPGVDVRREYRRYYPTAEVAAHVLGFTNIDDQGQEGLELAFDDDLRGQPGKQEVVKDLIGRVIKTGKIQQAPRPGHDLYLSIDRRLQFIAYRELKKAVQRHQAKWASLVLLDAKTGEILAMVNQPAFNPNDRHQMRPEQLRNRAVTDLLEPGSTVKPFAVAAALKSGLFSRDTLIDTNPGRFRIGRKVISDFRNYGVIDVARVIQKSSNIGISKMALGIPKELLWETYADVGFGFAPATRFPGEAEGYLPFFGQWNDIERATIAFGYGLSVSPLQLAQAYTVFANDGELRRLSFLRRDEPMEGQQVLPAAVARQVRQMLESVVESDEGTGRRARIPGYRVAGKTGTVRKTGRGGYLEDSYRAMFVGMAPASDPRLVAVVVIDDPGGEDYYGGRVAAPVFAKVMAAALRLLNVPPDKISEDSWQPPLRMAGATQL